LDVVINKGLASAVVVAKMFGFGGAVVLGEIDAGDIFWIVAAGFAGAVEPVGWVILAKFDEGGGADPNGFDFDWSNAAEALVERLPKTALHAFPCSAVDVHEEQDRFSLSGVNNSMRNIGAIVGGVAGAEGFGVGGRFDADLTFLEGEEFAGAFEMRGTAEGAAGLKLDFVEFHVLFEVERGKGADAAMFIRAVMVCMVLGANDGDGGGGVGGFEEVAETHGKGAGDAESDSESGVGLVALDLAEHGTADAAGVGEGFERPTAVGAKFFDAIAEAVVD
jgi:hypothetical protein